MTDDITGAYDAFRAEHLDDWPHFRVADAEARWHRLYSALEQLPTDTLRAFIAIADVREPTGDLMRTLPRLIVEARAEEPACRNCKHWTPTPETGALARTDVGVCEQATFARFLDERSLVYADALDSSGAQLVTKAAFYCAHFERKEG